MVQAFRMFDTDGSGAISTLEFRDVCLAVGMTPTDDELKVATLMHTHRHTRIHTQHQGVMCGER